MIIKRLAFVCLIVLSNSAYADDTSKEDKLLQFVRLFEPTNVVKEYKLSCMERYKAYNPETIVKYNPNYFSGIKPGSKKWPKLIDTWRRTAEMTCGGLTVKDVEEETVRAYHKLLSEDDLDAVLKFYHTEHGINVLRAEKLVMHIMQEYYSKIADERMKRGTNNLYKEINNILTAE
jgi:Uncharacterized protein conserved in bacteria (DUF2059)